MNVSVPQISVWSVLSLLWNARPKSVSLQVILHVSSSFSSISTKTLSGFKSRCIRFFSLWIYLSASKIYLTIFEASSSVIGIPFYVLACKYSSKLPSAQSSITMQIWVSSSIRSITLTMFVCDICSKASISPYTNFKPSCFSSAMNFLFMTLIAQSVPWTLFIAVYTVP